MTGPSFGLAARQPDRPAPVFAHSKAGESIEESTGPRSTRTALPWRPVIFGPG